MLYRTKRQIRGVFFAIVVSMVWSCKPNAMLDTAGGGGTSRLQATGIENSRGSRLRCDVVYPDMYKRALPIYKRLIERHRNVENQVATPPMSSPVAKRIVGGIHQMVLNMARSQARPVDPVGFFAVIKDFESSVDVEHWGITEQTGVSRFRFFTNACVGRCYGYFQVGLDQEKPSWNLEEVCGKNGLDVLKPELVGAPDFCSALYWWIDAENGWKCYKLLDYRFGYRLNDEMSPCVDTSYAWTPDTFAYAWRDAYIQANQWAGYGYEDSWKKMYEGFDHRGVKNLGYEHCAVEYYLKTYRGAPKDWQISYDFPVRDYISSAVRRFLYEIGTMPVWEESSWTPSLAKKGKDFPTHVSMTVNGEVKEFPLKGEVVDAVDASGVKERGSKPWYCMGGNIKVFDSCKDR